MTEFEKRKQAMKELWKDTFHDSDRYIDLVFDTYYSMENSFIRSYENRIIAALLCVGYEFQILTKEGYKRHMKGFYLCGLATRPDWRRNGIMGELMKEAEDSAEARGYDFTFLIPADDHLREYYRRKEYLTSSWRLHQEVKCVKYPENTPPASLHIYSIKELFTRGKIEFLTELAEWCREIEKSRQTNTILHSLRDILAIMAENENSIFFTDATFNPEYPILAKVRGVAFPEVSDASDEPIKLVGMYCQDDYYTKVVVNPTSTLRESLLQWFDGKNLELLLPVKDNDNYDGQVVPYAMIKPLSDNFRSEFENENLNIEISLMLD